MAKAALRDLHRTAQQMLGLLCTEWTKQGLTEKQILRKAKPYTEAIKRAAEALGRGEVAGKN